MPRIDFCPEIRPGGTVSHVRTQGFVFPLGVLISPRRIAGWYSLDIEFSLNRRICFLLDQSLV
jgi:hypothetical protein